MSRESVMPSNHLILCHSLLLPPSIFPSIRVFSNESVLCIRWPTYWSFSFSISPSKKHSGLISFIQSLQFSRSVMSDSLRPHESQHARPPCLSLKPGAYSNSCPLSRCVDHNKLEISEGDGNTRPPDLPLEKPVCRSGSNS